MTMRYGYRPVHIDKNFKPQDRYEYAHSLRYGIGQADSGGDPTAGSDPSISSSYGTGDPSGSSSDGWQADSGGDPTAGSLQSGSSSDGSSGPSALDIAGSVVTDLTHLAPAAAAIYTAAGGKPNVVTNYVNPALGPSGPSTIGPYADRKYGIAKAPPPAPSGLTGTLVKVLAAGGAAGAALWYFFGGRKKR